MKLKLILSISIFCTLFSFLFAATYVPENSNRVKVNFNVGWLFKWGDFAGAEAPTFDDGSWYAVHLPHSVRLEPLVNSGGKNYQGIAWYRKHFTIPTQYSGKKLFLKFEGAMQIATVYVNGVLRTKHYGGYLPFTIDLSDLTADGTTQHVIAVRVDNRDNGDVPPGQPQGQLDFNYFGGIYRDVNLHVTDKLHVTDAVYANKTADGGIFVTYNNVSTSSAQVIVKANIKNENPATTSCVVKNEIVDVNNNLVATLTSSSVGISAGSDNTFTQTLTVTSPNLWHPDHPYLYKLYTTVLSNGSLGVDVYETKIGIRWIEFNLTDGFKLNGTRLIMNGFNRHQEYVNVGYAMSHELNRQDVIKMREAGFNMCRIGHYPNDPSFMDALDELGMMAIVPPPGWHYYKDSDPFRSRAQQDVRDMIRRDRNHPSVVLWEPILNEVGMTPTYLSEVYNITHQEYPGSQCYAACDPYQSTNFDVIYGWETRTDKPTLSREYNDGLDCQNWTNNDPRKYDPTYRHYRCERGTNGFYTGGEAGMLLNCATRENGGPSPHLTSLSGHWSLVKQNKGFAGMAIWTGIDHNRGGMPSMAATGLLDLYRLPKFAYYMYKSQRDPNIDLSGIGVESGPTVFIANYWTANSTRDVKVFANCEQVKLYVNGTLIGTQSPQTGMNHPRPSFVFPNVTFSAGTLRAEGLIGGIVRATHEVKTPGEPSKIVLVADSYGKNLTANGSDLMMVYAYVKDTNDVTCPLAYNKIEFSISGPGVLVGSNDVRVGANPIQAVAGIIGIIVRATTNSGTITVTAQSSGLTAGTVNITSVAMTEPRILGILHANAQEPPVSPFTGDVDAYLSDLDWISESSGWIGHFTGRDRSIEQTPITINGFTYAKGLGTHAASEIRYSLLGKYAKFVSDIGIDDETLGLGSVVFQVYGDNVLLYDSGLVTGNPPTPTKRVEVSVSGVDELRLIVTDGGNGVGNDHADWADAKVLKSPIIPIPRANIARGKSASASSYDPSYPPNYANDGNTDSRWKASSTSLPQAYTIDLGKDYNLTGVKIVWDIDRNYYNHTVSVSPDNVNYRDLFTASRSGQDFLVDPINADGMRYVKVNVTGILDITKVASIIEMEVYSDFVYASDLNWAYQTSGWPEYPTQKDQSIENNVLTLEGIEYSKGLGMHANGEVYYNLGGKYSRFLSTIGIDDEVAGGGSVLFQVFGDGVKLYDSGYMNGATLSKNIDVDITNVQVLKLVVNDSSNGVQDDHGDWADARFVPLKVDYCSDLTWASASNGWGPVERDMANGGNGTGDGGMISINGRKYTKGLGVHAASEVIYDVNTKASKFLAFVGVDDEVAPFNGSVIFQVWGDGNKLYDSGVMSRISVAKFVDVNISSVNQLRLVVTDGGDGIGHDHGDWADARIIWKDTSANKIYGFALWANGKGLTGDAATLFAQDRNGDGVSNGFEYVFGTNLTSGAPLLTIRMVNGRPVIEIPAQDASTLPYATLRVVGCTDLIDWSLPVIPRADTTGKPANRNWFEPQGSLPTKAFFRLEAN